MSSHHIIREKQEPALLIMSLDNFDQEYLGQLLEWSPSVIVSDDLYEITDSMGIKIDGVLTSNDYLDVQSNTRIINSGPDQIEDALKFLIAEEYPAVNIITNQFNTKDYALFIDFIDIVVYSGNKKIFAVKPGFSKWKPAGEKVELLHEVTGLQAANLKHIETLVFETEKDGFYTLIFDQEFVFIAEDY
jgi:thiamine pyrophosphokinase